MRLVRSQSRPDYGEYLTGEQVVPGVWSVMRTGIRPRWRFTHTVEVSSTSQLEAAAAAAAPYTRIHLAEGTYYRIDLTGCTGPILVAGPATMTGSLTIDASTDVVVSGIDLVGSGRVIFESGATRCRYTNGRVATSNAKFITLRGTDNRVDHCELGPKSCDGAMVYVAENNTSHGHRIDHNWLHDFERATPVNGGEAICIGDGYPDQCRAIRIDHNLLERIGWEREAVCLKADHVRVVRNRFVGCTASLSLRSGRRCVVRGNVFDGAGGIIVGGNGHDLNGNHFGEQSMGILLRAGHADEPLCVNNYWAAHDCELRGNRGATVTEQYDLGRVTTCSAEGEPQHGTPQTVDTEHTGVTVTDDEGEADMSAAVSRDDVGPRTLRTTVTAMVPQLSDLVDATEDDVPTYDNPGHPLHGRRLLRRVMSSEPDTEYTAAGPREVQYD